MTGLLLFAALITAATVWYVSRPIRGRAALPAEEHDDGLAQVRDRLLAQLRELDVEVGDRNVDPSIAADERRRLEAELAHVLRALEARHAEAGGSAGGYVGDAAPAGGEEARPLLRLVVVILALNVPLVSAGLYFAMNGTMLGQLGRAGMSASAGAPPNVGEMVGRLERRLAEQPADSRGWAMLGRSYAVLGRASEAQRAYARAYQLAPDDSEIVAAYADFLISLDPVRPSAEAAALFRKLHQLEPQNPAALWGLGLVAFHEEKFGQAVKYWELLLEQLPPGSEAGEQVRHAIEAARAQAQKR